MEGIVGLVEEGRLDEIKVDIGRRKAEDVGEWDKYLAVAGLDVLNAEI